LSIARPYECLEHSQFFFIYELVLKLIAGILFPGSWRFFFWTYIANAGKWIVNAANSPSADETDI